MGKPRQRSAGGAFCIKILLQTALFLINEAEASLPPLDMVLLGLLLHQKP
jgi:hypothetical protein